MYNSKTSISYSQSSLQTRLNFRTNMIMVKIYCYFEYEGAYRRLVNVGRQKIPTNSWHDRFLAPFSNFLYTEMGFTVNRCLPNLVTSTKSKSVQQWYLVFQYKWNWKTASKNDHRHEFAVVFFLPTFSSRLDVHSSWIDYNHRLHIDSPLFYRTIWMVQKFSGMCENIQETMPDWYQDSTCHRKKLRTFCDRSQCNASNKNRKQWTHRTDEFCEACWSANYYWRTTGRLL